MIKDAEKIIDQVNDFLTHDYDPFVKVFLIRKTKYRDIFKKFNVNVVEIEDSLKKDFKETMKEALQEINESSGKIKNFSDPEHTDGYRIIKKHLLPELGGMLNELEIQKDVQTITSFKNVENDSRVYCFQFKVDNQRIFAFADIVHYMLPEQQQYIMAEFSREHKLKKKTTETVVMSKDVFCIYFKDLDMLLTIDYPKTKSLLNFSEQFKNKCKKLITEDLIDVISVEKDDMEKVLANQAYNELMIKMHDGNRIDKEKTHFKQWNEFYDNVPLEEVDKLILDSDGKPIIKKAIDLAQFLYVADNDIMEGVVRRGEFALVLSKKILKRKHVKS